MRVQQHENFSPGGSSPARLGIFALCNSPGVATLPFEECSVVIDLLFSSFHFSQSDLRSFFPHFFSLFRFLYFLLFFFFSSTRIVDDTRLDPLDRLSRVSAVSSPRIELRGSRTRSRVNLKNGTRTDSRPGSFQNFPRSESESLKMAVSKIRSFLRIAETTHACNSSSAEDRKSSTERCPETARLAQSQPSFPRRRCASQ